MTAGDPREQFPLLKCKSVEFEGIVESMKVTTTSLDGVKLIEPDVFADARGQFQELWQRNRYLEASLGLQYLQDNLSRSTRNTLRGLHYQIDRPQGKLIQVLDGRIYDVAVDMRRASPTFGEWFGIELKSETPRQIYIGPGFAHGFLVLSEHAMVLYKCTDLYSPNGERSLLWNDPELGIDWPLDGEPKLSEKDRDGIPLAQAEVFERV